MKRFLALLLVLALMLCGCAAGEALAGIINEGVGAERATTPTEGIQIDFDAPALVLTVKINPELEISLDAMQTVLSVTALNADAEALLANLDLVGMSCNESIKAVLTEAKAQGYLGDGGTVSIIAEEKQSGSWTVASQRLLEMPIKEFQAESGIQITFDLTAESDGYDPNELILKHTEQGEDYAGTYTCDYYYQGRENVMNVLTYDNGTRVERYFLAARNDTLLESAEMWYFPDGSYRYSYGNSDYSYRYEQNADGTWVSVTRVGNREEWKYSSGDNYIYTYHDNGNLATSDSTWANGDSRYDEYDEDGNWIHASVRYADGRRVDTYYDKNGNVTDYSLFYPEGYTVTVDNGDGSTTTCTYYENGNPATDTRTWANGDYEKMTYNEDDTFAYQESLRDGVYSEITYGKDNKLLMTYSRFADGKEHTDYYDSDGNLEKSYAVYENGNYVEYTYDKNGNLVFSIQSRDGDYVETSFHADGSFTNRYRNADGTSGTREWDANGNMISDTPD